jgi:hypothetical protein
VDLIEDTNSDIRVLVLPDGHMHPEFSNDRFAALGEMILDLRPDELWCLGDLADMPSLSSYDKGKRSFEGRRYKADIEVTHDGLEKLFGAVNRHNDQQRKNRKATYNPYKLLTSGNHSDRINRVTQLNPELFGAISTDDLGFQDYFDEIVDFKQTAIRHGFAISHYFPSGIKGQPIGGVHAAYNLITKNGMSSIAGHSHLWDMKILTRADGQKLLGLVAGCYVQHMWDLSVTLLDGVKNGFAESVTRITQDRIMKIYG